MRDDGLRKAFDRRRIGVDVAKYQAMIDEVGVTEEEKRVAIERMWQILMVFVDLGFELHPVEFPCGKNTDEDSSRCNGAHDLIELEEFLKQKFADVAREE